MNHSVQKFAKEIFLKRSNSLCRIRNNSSNKKNNNIALLRGTCSYFSSGPREEASIEESIIERLSKINDPILQRPISELGFIKKLKIDKEKGNLSLDIQLPSLAHPFKSDIHSNCMRALDNLGDGLEWVKNVNIALTAGKARSSSAPTGSGIVNVTNIIAVSSCKGGVGKSTVAMNLALELVKLGGRVGLLDADIYGPSLPALTNLTNPPMQPSPDHRKFVLPVEYEGLKCMSFGFVNPKTKIPGAGGQGAAVMRGPMVSKVINQLLLQTDWGELDYLVIDMPPGTGDIQMTLCQTLSLNGALIVSTPQKLSHVDVVKGIEMFQHLEVPTIGIIENMAFFNCGSCNEKHYPFGKGKTKNIYEKMLVNKTNYEDTTTANDNNINKNSTADFFQLPLSENISNGNDEGLPISIGQPDSLETSIYHDMAKHVVSECLKQKYSSIEDMFRTEQIFYDAKRDNGCIVLRFMHGNGAEEFTIKPMRLRMSDPQTGDLYNDDMSIPVSKTDTDGNVIPIKFDRKGNYGVSIVWSDGYHASIYSFDILKKIAMNDIKESKQINQQKAII